MVAGPQGLSFYGERPTNLSRQQTHMNTTVNIEIPQRIECEFESNNGIVLIQVLLNGKKRTFLLDSGAPFMTLNTRHVHPDHIEAGLLEFRGIGGGVQSSRARITTFNWQGFKLRNSLVYAMDLAHLERELGVEFHGLIGYRELMHFTLNIDYKAKRLTLWREFNPSDFTVLARIPFVLYNHLPVIRANIGKRGVKLGLDSGAAINLLDVNLLSSIEGFSPAGREEQLHGAGSNSVKVQHGRLTSTVIQGTKFNNMRVVWSDVSVIKHSLGDIDGLLGYEFLSKRRMAVSFTDNCIYLIRKKRGGSEVPGDARED